MRQLVQSVHSGELRIASGPDPIIGPTEVLVQTSYSMLSAGTERAVRDLASSSTLRKARARPDLVRQVIRRARGNGIRSTFHSVRERLNDEMPLGYSAAGTVIEVGEAVAGIRPGIRVATGGAGHGDLQVVAGLLAVPVPDNVTDGDASLATVAAVALHGLRLADIAPGATICVVGLGLLGQLSARLALAAGAKVFGIDVRPWTVERARAADIEATEEEGDATTEHLVAWNRGRGADAVVIAAATSSSTPARLAPTRVRDRGTIVVIGDVGLDLERGPLYEREVSLKVARSYGPGRYDRAYEEWAVDYPIGHVRYTEGRNIEAVLDLMSARRVAVSDLITHRYPFDDATEAYRLLADRNADYLGIQLQYDRARTAFTRRPPRVSTAQRRTIGLVGAGRFTRGVLAPAIAESGLGQIVAVSSASGVSAARLADRIGASAVTTDDAIDDVDIHLIAIATSHDTHADLVVRALRAGKDVFVEKPLALSRDELDMIIDVWRNSPGRLAVGFNRRHAPDVQRVHAVLADRHAPLSITYRVNAETLPASHWYRDRPSGGRLLGEVCHFVDTCTAIVGRPPSSVTAVSAPGAEALLIDHLAASLTYPDGSVAAITYSGGGHHVSGKERIEILGGGHTLEVDDFRGTVVDGRRQRHPQDKGHVAQLRALARALTGDGDPDGGAVAAFASTSATLDLLTSVQTGRTISCVDFSGQRGEGA
jgi:predicted dehydrogenase/threonine dehydrogenase-like Zn-dependent dehydrogenase